jgi:sugar lactone lactonase YvrE
MSYRLSRRLAGRGETADKFRRELRAVACDGDGNWLLAGDQEVKRLTPDGDLVTRWPTSRPGWSLTVDDEGRVWVGEQGRIEIFSHDGELEDTWQDEGLFRQVTALAVTSEDVFVADVGSRWIHRVDRTGSLLNHIGDHHRKGGFHIPNGVLDFALDDDGTLVVANPGMHRVERYLADGTSRGFFGRFGQHDPAAFPGCCNPTNLTLGPGGEIVVSEKAGPRVKIFDRDGGLIEVVADTEQFDAACKNLDLAVNPQGVIGVADTVMLSLAIFEPQPTPDRAVSSGADS